MPHRGLYRDASLRTLLLGRRRGLRVSDGRPSRHLRRAVIAGAGTALIAAAAVGGLAWRLTESPLALDLLKPHIEDTLNEAFGGQVGVALGAVSVETGGATGLRLRAANVALRDRGGRPLGTIGTAELGLDPALLLLGQVQVRRVALEAPAIRVRRTGEGLDVAAAPRQAPAGAAAATQPTADALETLTAALDAALRFASTGAEGLQALQIRRAELDYADDNGGRFVLPDLDVELRRAAGSPVTLRIATGSAAARLHGLIQAWDVDGRREIEGRIDGIRLAALGPALSKPEIAALAQQPLSLAFAVPFSDGGITGATATLEGASFESPVDATRPFRGAVRFKLDSAARQILVEPSRIGFARGSGMLSGTLQWGSGDEFGLRLLAERMRLDHVEGAGPLDVRSISLEGKGSFREKSLRIDRLALDSERARVSLAGTVALGERSPAVRLAGEASAADIAAAKQVWPVFVAPQARRWVIGNVDTGRLVALRFRVDADKDWFVRAEDREMLLPKDAISVSFDFDGARFQTVGSLPALDIEGSGTIDGNAMALVGSGSAKLPSGRSLRLRQGRFEVPNVHPRTVEGIMTLDIESETAALAELIGRRPLDRLGQKLPFGPADVTGRALTRMRIALPLKADVLPEAVAWNGDIELSDLAISGLAEGRKLEKARVTLRLADGGLSSSGKGILDGVPANIDLQIDDLLKDEGTRSYGVTMLVDEKTGERFGLALRGLVQGPMVLKTHGDMDGDGAKHIELDLTNARIATAGLGTLKPEGRKAQASFTLQPEANGKELRDFRLTSDGVQARGTVRLGQDGSFSSAEINEFRLGATDQSSLVMRSQNGVLNVQIAGKSFDAGRFLRALTAGGESSGRGGAVDLGIKVDRLVGLNGEELRGASLHYAGQDGRISDLTLSGRFASGGAVGARTRTEASRREVVLVSHNAGALLRFLDIYSRIQQGGLELRMDVTGSRMAGSVSMVDFRVVDEEGLRKLVGSVGRPLRQDETEIGATQPFQNLRLSFVKSGDVIQIENGVASGPISGATFTGSIDRRTERVDVSGTYVPIYLLNNMFAKLPLVGPILGGRSGEGLLGVTFALRGAIDSPRLLVNPVSVAAPGVLRHLFEFATGGQAQQPDPGQGN